MAGKCKLESAFDGNQVPVYERDGQKKHLGSRYDGRYMANKWLEYHVDDHTENLLLFGIGDGQIVRAALEYVPGNIVVFEPSGEIYQAVKKTEIFKKITGVSRVHFFYGSSGFREAEHKIRRILNEDCVEVTMLAVHPGYAGMYPEELSRLHDICEKICGEIAFMKKPIQRFIHAMIHNQLTNIPHIKGGIPIARLRKYWKPDVPVIMVSAGPSLDKNAGWLENAKGKAFIFCVDAALPALLEKGIVPDLVACTDAMKNMNCFEDQRSFQIPLLVTTNSPCELLEKSSAVKIWGDDHAFVQMLFGEIGIELPRIPFYSGVATALFASILELGTKEIIMVGQDLAYSEDGKSHITGRDEGFVKDENFKAEGYYGGEVWSRGDWISFLNWFEKMISHFPACTVTNCTEGGVKIRGTKQKPLKEVLANLPCKGSEMSQILENRNIYMSDSEYSRLISEYCKCRSDLKIIREQGYERTFFQEDYRSIPVMRLVIDCMKSMEDSDRRTRFEKSVAWISEELEKTDQINTLIG